MDLTKLTIKKINDGFRKGRFSANELFEESKKIIEAKDPSLHVFVSKTYELAEKSLKNKTSILHGVPASLKDNFNWKGTKTTASSKILNNYESVYDATVTSRLLSNGAMFMGKTNMDAFAHGSSTETSDYFVTLNPIDNTRVPGGSSGGSAASVASGMCVYSIGSETAGSVRGPACWCGIYGFAPTYGRFSRYGLIAMGSSLDRPGVFTNSVDDAALLLKLLSGHDPKDATSIQEPSLDLTDEIKGDIKGLKIGIPKQYFDNRIEKDVLDKTKVALSELESQGAKLIEIDLMDPKYSIAVYTVICRSEVSSNLARIDGIRYGFRSEKVANSILDQISYNRGEGFGLEAKRRSMTGAYTLSAGYYDAYYKKAQKVRTLIINDFAKAFEKVDLIAGPTMPSTAPRLGISQSSPVFGELADELTEASALAGLPCISVPVGIDHNNLPIGMQIIGKQFDEKGVLNLAKAWENLSN